jgi:alpha-acetolactate decarboxylase
MAALLDTVYDGEVTVDQFSEQLDFGLGIFNALFGEMIVHDGTVHQLRSDGGATDVSPDMQTPFACVTHFDPEEAVTIELRARGHGWAGAAPAMVAATLNLDPAVIASFPRTGVAVMPA